MFLVITIMFIGIGVGFLFRKHPILQKVASPISWTIYLLLFLLGISVGNNQTVISHLPTLGGTALMIAVAGTTGSIIMGWLVWKVAFKKEINQTEEKDER